MKSNLLQHIKSLSNSKLGHASALEQFAHCLNSVYGDCSFISFEVCPKTGKYLVRLIFSDDQGVAPKFENLVGQHVAIDDQQLHDIVMHEDPMVVKEIKFELAREVEQFGLPTASMMVLPIYLDGTISLWVIVLGHRANQFAEVDMDQAILLANLAGTYMARITETELLAEANAWIKKELTDIGRIQKLLLPQEAIDLRGTDVASYFSICDQAGGDYFDIANLSVLYRDEFAENSSDAWGVIVADASGHGAASAVEIAMFDAILRTYDGKASQGPANVFTYTNKYFFTRIGRGSFITASIVAYFPHQQSLIYGNAGHPPTLLLEPNGQIVQLDQSEGIPLGVDPNWEWRNIIYEVKPGTVVVSYTDGIIESLSPDKHQFGLEAFKKVLQETYNSGTHIAQDYVDAVSSALHDHQQDHPQTDDQCMVVMSIN